MSLKELLELRRSDILNDWKKKTLNAEEKNKFSKSILKMDNPFINPVGVNVSEALSGLYESLLNQRDGAADMLDDILRIRAVQEITPGESIRFLIQFKEIVENHIPELKKDMNLKLELAEFYFRVDELMLQGFDIYMQCREQLWNIKMDEIKNNTNPDFDPSMSCSSKIESEC